MGVLTGCAIIVLRGGGGATSFVLLCPKKEVIGLTETRKGENGRLTILLCGNHSKE